jgi:hypothetical protein
MDRTSEPSPTPKDATKATDEQREWQQELDDRGEDPQGPGLQQDRHQIADET